MIYIITVFGELDGRVDLSLHIWPSLLTDLLLEDWSILVLFSKDGGRYSSMASGVRSFVSGGEGGRGLRVVLDWSLMACRIVGLRKPDCTGFGG